MRKNLSFFIRIVVLYGFIIFDYFFEKFINAFTIANFNVSVQLVYFFLKCFIFGVLSTSAVLTIFEMGKRCKIFVFILLTVSLGVAILNIIFETFNFLFCSYIMWNVFEHTCFKYKKEI